MASRFILPGENLNYAYRDPFFNRSWGPAPLHLGLTFAVLVAVVYWPTHAVLRRWLGRGPGITLVRTASM
jgi:hypothetical protein